MKAMLTKLFWPILKFFEVGQEPPNYKPSHRLALNVLGYLFMFLSGVSAVSAFYSEISIGALVPIIVFFTVGFVAVIVGSLGTNRAVAKVWGTK
ncbi:hypothetical protein ACMUMK_08155 [Paraglaciecola sp. 2405UD69-4]